MEDVQGRSLIRVIGEAVLWRLSLIVGAILIAAAIGTTIDAIAAARADAYPYGCLGPPF